MQSDNDNHSAGSNGYNSLTNQTNTSSSSGVVPSNRHCTGNHVVFRSGCRSNSPGDGHTNSIVRYNAPPWGGWQTPEYPQHKTINHDLLSSTSSLLVLGKVEEQEKNPAMEPQHPSVGVACNGLGPAGCVYHSTEIYGGDTYASYNLDGNMPRGEKDRGPNSQTSTGDVVPAPVFNRGGGTGCNIFHLECHDTERLESIEYGWGGGRPALCRKWNGVTNTGGAGTEGVLPEQKVPEKNAATTGLSPTNFTPQYHDIDCRLLDGYRESREFLPYKIAIQKALSRDGLEQTRVTIPVDTSKRRHVEAAITARGLTLLSEYPVTNQLLFYAKDQGGIMEPIVCVTNFRGYKPEEYFDRSDRVFRWSFIFVSGNGEVHQWDPEGCGFCIGKWDNVDVEKVVRFAADWISGGVESEDGSEQDSDGSN